MPSSKNNSSYRTLNPATGELVHAYSFLRWQEATRKLQSGFTAFQVWRETSFDKRRELVLRLAELLRQKKAEFALLITTEMGKPIRQSESEIDKCIWGCEFYANEAQGFLKEENILTDAAKSYVRYDPLGIILGIMPWNFPFWQVFRFSIPALMAGNAVVLKHAPNVPGSALAIEALFREAGFPEFLFQSFFVELQDVEKVIASPYVQGVSLTGSDRAGSAVAALAGKYLKKTVLELGGSDPFIVLSDANIEAAIPVAIRSRMLNSGQSCIAAKRIILSKKIAPDFEKAFTQAVSELKAGDPKDRLTDVGPLARQDLLENLTRQVEASLQQGAKALVGGQPLEGAGFFYPPTLLKDIREGMPPCSEEIFGPVASLFVVSGDDEAIHLANQTEYGLGASLWTSNITHAETLARKIDAGSVFINGMVKSDPRLPFGGVKRSGYGRELGPWGMHEFTNIKTVWIAK